MSDVFVFFQINLFKRLSLTWPLNPITTLTLTPLIPDDGFYIFQCFLLVNLHPSSHTNTHVYKSEVVLRQRICAVPWRTTRWPWNFTSIFIIINITFSHKQQIHWRYTNVIAGPAQLLFYLFIYLFIHLFTILNFTGTWITVFMIRANSK